MRVFPRLFLPLLALTWGATAKADEAQGLITRIDSTEAQNYGIRIYLGNKPLCSAPVKTWAYMNKSWDNYEATLSLLLTAYALKKTVTVISNSDGYYCRLSYIIVE